MAAVKNPVFIDMTLITGVAPFPGSFAGGLGGTDGFGVGDIGRLIPAGLAFTMEFIFDGVVGGVCISTTISPFIFPGPDFGGPFAIGRCAGA